MKKVKRETTNLEVANATAKKVRTLAKKEQRSYHIVTTRLLEKALLMERN